MLDEWFAETLRSYPSETARLLADVTDRFRNPAGHTLRTGLAALLDAVLEGGAQDTAARALGDVVQLRAVQGFSCEEAVGFLVRLKAIVRRDRETDGDAGMGEVDARIDALSEEARRLHDAFRARVADMRARAERRRAWVADRIAHRS